MSAPRTVRDRARTTRAGAAAALAWTLGGCVSPSAAAPGDDAHEAAQAHGATAAAANAAPAAQAAASSEGALPAGAVSVAAHAAQHSSFDAYWYQGVGELNRYALDQFRYGENHAGVAVWVFVTEDFLATRHVKHEFGPDDDAVSVLKHNAWRHFYTGVYPYSVLTSAFVPAGDASASALKVVCTVQEWCGTTFEQFNRRGDGWDVELRSYFQAEGDASGRVDGLLEDELPARIRRGPATLPTGEQHVVPAAHALRMLHREARGEQATISVAEVASTPRGGEQALAVTVRYTELDREVTYYAAPAFPWQIVAWTERDGRAPGRVGTTTGTLVASYLTDYWARHGADDGAFREALGLSRP